ncbi:transcriptional regulator [Nocardia farcinica]|nr:transcriptional regulator [Nocardia farcinica]
MTSTCHSLLVESDLVYDVMDPDCPSRPILQRLGGKWSMLVLQALADGPLRFTGLRATVAGITPKVLTQTLTSLERDGLLTRTHYPEIPPRVEYALTPLGRDALVPLIAMRRWAEANAPAIRAAQQAYDARGDG